MKRLSRFEPFRLRLYCSNFKNFFLASAHEREVRATLELYRRASEAYPRHPLAAEDDRLDFVLDIVEDIQRDRELPEALRYALVHIIDHLLSFDALTGLPEAPAADRLSPEEGVALRSRLWRLLRSIEDWDRLSGLWRDKIVILFSGIHECLPRSALKQSAADAPTVSVPLIDLVEDPADVVERTVATMYDDDITLAHLFEDVREQLERNLCAVSGIPFERRGENTKALVLPTKYHAKSNADVVDTYLHNTPLARLFDVPLPFTIPTPARFEHMHILAGSGHGKTQTLQHLIRADLAQPSPPSLVIIDSQGDMLRKLSRLALFDPEQGPLAHRLIMIDPPDIEHPPALNMFDVNFDRLGGYRPAAREQILNGVIELYDYMFGSLLGAELTQKQRVIFRYIARLMLAIPGATIRTLIELMTDATPYFQYISELPPSARMFFETEFPHKSFADTKRQIQRRLWGILENPTFERMLIASKNRIDMFDALNSGKIVLVNTAKDFLKAERSSFLGRFFIALTLQAALERAALPERERRPAFLYVDEASDYFDDNIDDLLTQARKYHLGVVFSHQYLGQLAPALHSSIASNTSIKLAGGISDRDARSMAPDMRTTPTFILDQRKQEQGTQFACYIRNHTPTALSLSIPFGSLEAEPVMDEAAFAQLQDENRGRICCAVPEEPVATFSEPEEPSPPKSDPPKRSKDRGRPPPKSRASSEQIPEDDWVS